MELCSDVVNAVDGFIEARGSVFRSPKSRYYCKPLGYCCVDVTGFFFSWQLILVMVLST